MSLRELGGGVGCVESARHFSTDPDRAIPPSILFSGVGYPLLRFIGRRVLQRFVCMRVSSDSLDLAGVIVLLLEVGTSAPQFYVLTLYVLTLTRSKSSF